MHLKPYSLFVKPHLWCPIMSLSDKINTHRARDASASQALVLMVVVAWYMESVIIVCI
jgi:hypothetical protein